MYVENIQNSPVANSALIRQSPLFSSLPGPLLNEMADHFRLVEWHKNQVIDPEILLSQFYFVLEGQLEFKRINPENGREISLDMLYQGDSFDVVTLLDGEIHNMVISPLSDLKLIALPIEMMRQWIWIYPELNKQFLPYLAQKIRDQENQLTNIALYDVSTRLSRIILKHLNKIHFYRGEQNNAHQDHLITGMSDEILARMVGSVRQVINKQLQNWKSKGILNKKRNQLIIHDLEALNKEAKKTQTFF